MSEDSRRLGIHSNSDADMLDYSSSGLVDCSKVVSNCDMYAVTNIGINLLAYSARTFFSNLAYNW